jgi:hypothetical protein
MRKVTVPKAKIKRRVNKRIHENKNSHPNKMITSSKTKRNVIRVFNKENLMKAAHHAENTDKNRSVYTNMLQEHIDEQPEDTLYPIVFDMIHNNIEFRVQIQIDENIDIWLDIDMDKFNKWTMWHDKV